MNISLPIRRTTTILSFAGVLLIGSLTPSMAATTSPKATPKATAKATPKATTKAAPKVAAKTAAPKIVLPSTAAAAGGQEGRGGAGRFANITTAQRTCLAGQGVKLPAPRTPGAVPTARPTGTPNAGGTPRAFGGGAGGFNSPTTIAAFKKCGVTLPTNNFGAQFNSPKFVAFQKCMTAAGFKPTGGFGQYDQADPDTAIALIKCQKSSGFTLPKRG